MTFNDAVQNAMPVWFGADMADLVILNGVTVPAQVTEHGLAERDDGLVDYVTVVFQKQDYPVVSYRRDTAVIDGLLWRFPVVTHNDTWTTTVRFRRNPRVRVSGGRP